MSKHHAIVDAQGRIVNIVLWDGVPYTETLIPAVTEEIPAKLDKDGKEIEPARQVVVEPERTEFKGWKPPNDHTAIEIEGAMIGGTYLNGVYTPPPQPREY